ncbi:uncharacterized protein LOC135150054 [Daucus carota subsp. sativus]|uniref:uncharacterized protein LOC135150054 n=1 Tax=Daucus carota subsp. sativus TaxID=79200 RepID=UPI00308363D2
MTVGQTMEQMQKQIAILSGEGEDRISWLSNDLIHEILSFVDAKSAVQTSVLSKRWKLVWTTLPYVNFTNYIFLESELHILETRSRFISKFFLRRNILSNLLKVNFEFDHVVEQLLFPQYMFEAMFNNARDIKFETSASGFKLDSCIYSMNSPSLHKLTLRPIQGELSTTGCWNLPALTTLNLAAQPDHRILLPELHLLCLPALRTLVLEGLQLPDPISLPALTTLHLTNCILPQNSWDFPALLTLRLDAVSFPESRFFSALVNLKSLILFFRENITEECLISCPQLENLEIISPVRTTTYHSGNIIVLAHHIRNFTSVGFFPIMFGVSELENVNIKLRGSNGDEPLASLEEFKLYYTRVVYMFPGLSNAKILTLDSATVQALSAVSKLLVQVPSPFYQLNHVKVPQGHKDSSISADLKRYLLGRSPEATIVTKLPQYNSASMSCQRFQRQLPGNLATPVAEPKNDRASSSRASGETGLWKGHEVNSEFLSLLDCIEKKYPETFDPFTTNSKKLCTMKLNMLCTIVKDYTRTLMTEVDIEMIAEYRAQFANLQRSFNVKWLVNHLNCVEQFQIVHLLPDKLDAVDSFIANGSIGDHLFSGF